MTDAEPTPNASFDLTAETGEPLVHIEGLKTYYGGEGLFAGPPVRAVDGVDLTIHRGETLGLVGESGSGKTTLGRTLMQLESATDGEIHVGGADVATLSGDDLRAWRRNAQMVFQDPESSLNDRMTVGEIVREPLDVHDWPDLSVAVDGASLPVTGDGTDASTDDGTGTRAADNGRLEGDSRVDNRRTDDSRADITVSVADDEVTNVAVRDAIALSPDDVDAAVVQRRDGERALRVEVATPKQHLRREHVRNLLETVGLQREHYFRYPHQFSGGQRQRVGIARALALEPEFVVLDEPVSALDVSVQAKVLNLLSDLQAEFGLTYLFIAHDLSVVRHICDRVAVMYLGHLMEVGPTGRIFEDPANPYTHALLSAIPDPDPTSETRRITLRGTPPSPRNPPAGCPFSTRCPVKIRPEAYRDLDDRLWERIEVFRDVVRQRARHERSLTERAKDLLGIETRGADVDEIVDELFGDVDVPDRVRPHLTAAADDVRAGEEAAARDRLRDEFGSECDAETPAHRGIDGGTADSLPAEVTPATTRTTRTSRCHRHDLEHDGPAAAYDRLLDREDDYVGFTDD